MTRKGLRGQRRHEPRVRTNRGDARIRARAHRGPLRAMRPDEASIQDLEQALRRVLADESKLRGNRRYGVPRLEELAMLDLSISGMMMTGFNRAGLRRARHDHSWTDCACGLYPTSRAASCSTATCSVATGTRTWTARCTRVDWRVAAAQPAEGVIEKTSGRLSALARPARARCRRACAAPTRCSSFFTPPQRRTLGAAWHGWRKPQCWHGSCSYAIADGGLDRFRR